MDKKHENAHIRWMIRRDMPEIVDIEKLSFEFPWSEEDFTRRLLQRNVIGMVVENPEDEDEILGYMIFALNKKSIEVLNFAVHPHDVRSGVGSAMINKLDGKLNQQRRTKIKFTVRETNYIAQKFLSSKGFKAIGVIRDLYDDSPEDAYEFVYDISPKAHDKHSHRFSGVANDV